MGTTAQKLQAVLDSKAAIKDAIEEKGVTVGDAPLDEYASKIGEILAAIEEAPENDVNFYDYDGFRVASYTIEEAKALTVLPTPPTHEGLTFQEWNWTLEDIKTYDRQYADIGANYITTDGKTHIHCNITVQDVFLRIESASNNIVYIDWGDGSAVDSLTAGSGFTDLDFSHTYGHSGKYTIKIWGSKSSTNYRIIQNDKNVFSPNILIEEINAGNMLAFGFNYSLAYIYPKLLLSIATDTECGFIRSFLNTCCPQIVIPRNTSYANTGYNAFTRLNGRLSLPKTVVKCYSQKAYSNLVCNKIILPEMTDSVISVNNDVFQNNYYSSYISLPSTFQFASANTGYFTGCTNLKGLDIVQGWKPNYSLTLSQSTQWTAESMVKFFNKLGTTTNAITLTFGSTNLNKLTAEEKAIATNKGYTLA